MPERVLDLTAGITMVISDLHGDRDAFARHVGRFLQLRSRNKVQRILFLGDLIHSEGPEEHDASLQIMLDVMRMQRALPKGSVLMLLGNHEMPHLYGVTLAKGKVEYTPRFEQALSRSGKRDEVMAFLDELPLFVRTAAGVMFTHAGPHGNAAANYEKLRTFDHRALLEEFDHALAINPHPEQLRVLYGKTMGMPYEVLARYYLAVTGPDDPRYDHLIRSLMIGQQSQDFELLWDTLFTRCELGMPPPMYDRMLTVYLEAFSKGAPAPQRFLVTGHMPIEGGHAVVTERHLRIASGAHAHPREAGQHLLLDAGKPVQSMTELEGMLGSVF